MNNDNQLNINGHRRIVIEQVSPEIDGGRFPAKRCVNDLITVKATIFADGHDEIGAALKYRAEDSSNWQIIPCQFLGNDQWQASFLATRLGYYTYTLTAWIDQFRSWRHNLERWVKANEDVSIQLLIGANLIETTVPYANTEDAMRLQGFALALKNTQDTASAIERALDEELLFLMTQYVNTETAVSYEKELKIMIDREKARFSSWYEIFPRSLNPSKRHGTFTDLISHLPYIAEMGFDVIYLPPIHPIGTTFRKGKNNLLEAKLDEPGSPWGIGSEEGGHLSVHPQLGNLQEFQLLVTKAQEYGMEIALDFALQCSPEHPYVYQHPNWFNNRPDGTIQYAENPPKKYQDIYPLNFQSEQWQSLWKECKNILLFWIKQGIRIFRVDNPHTKPFVFWEWLIREIKKAYPEVIFLAEAFTRPAVMYYLAKLGFTQSYTYFTWRNTKAELTHYFTELNQPPICEFFRPHLWPNTPDILHEYLQTGGRPAFIVRLILAATLAGNYGIYGPAFELCVATPREAESEEYLDSEKYEIKHWDLDDPASLKPIITLVNKIRKENSSLHQNNLHFHSIDNPQLISYSKATPDFSNIIVVVVNLDPKYTQSGWLELPIHTFGIQAQESYSMHDLLNNTQYIWQGPRNYIELNPQKFPAHIFRLNLHHHREQNFDKY